MALRFRKRVRILPGVTLNISGSGVSTTLGPRGASVNIGKRGTYLNTGFPGTGISARQRLDPPVNPPAPRLQVAPPTVAPGRRPVWPWVAVGLVLVVLVLGLR